MSIVVDFELGLESQPSSAQPPLGLVLTSAQNPSRY